MKCTSVVSVFLAFIFASAQAADGPARTVGGEGSERLFKVTFYCSCSKCCGKHSPQQGGSGNTASGHSPVAFRTAAVGDPGLRGKWIFFEDLGAPILASDTGAVCVPVRSPRGRPRWKVPLRLLRKTVGCVATNQVDIFIGGPEMHKHALRLGVMEWKGRVLD
jgi:hypothetical protein